MPKTSSFALAEREPAPPQAPIAAGLASETDPRRRLVLAATQVFARHGYERATTREICQLAGANVAAIHYHFGDKAELYRETIRLPITQFAATTARLEQRDLSLAEALEAFFQAQLEPLLNGEDFDPLCVLLAREMADPSGVLGDTLAVAIAPHQRALEQLLRRHVGAARIDTDIELLAMALVGIGAHLTMARDVIDAMRPRLLSPRASVERAVERLTGWSVAMVESERRRRTASAPTRSRR